MAAVRGIFTACIIFIFLVKSASFIHINKCTTTRRYPPNLLSLITNDNFTKFEISTFELFSYLSPTKTYLGKGHFVPAERFIVNRCKNYAHINFSYTLMLFLMQSGDVHPHPGPVVADSQSCVKANSTTYKKGRQPKYPCVICEKGVTSRSKAVDCDVCGQWTHIKCSNYISDELYTYLSSCDDHSYKFTCSKCSFQDLPFHQYTEIGSTETNSFDISSDSSGPCSSYAPSTRDFNCFNRKGLHFIHFNVRSLLPKLDELKLFVSKYKLAVIALSETWLDHTVTDAEIHLDGYNVIRRDRDRQGGGVCLYIHEDIAFTERKDFESDRLEAVWANLLLPKTKPIIIGSCYRPPKQNNFTEVLESVLNNFRSDSEWYILGDFNICFLDKLSSMYKKFSQLLDIFNLKQIIVDPTRISVNSSSFRFNFSIWHSSCWSQ